MKPVCVKTLPKLSSMVTISISSWQLWLKTRPWYTQASKLKTAQPRLRASTLKKEVQIQWLITHSYSCSNSIMRYQSSNNSTWILNRPCTSPQIWIVLKTKAPSNLRLRAKPKLQRSKVVLVANQRAINTKENSLDIQRASRSRLSNRSIIRVLQTTYRHNSQSCRQ